jgi:uncharacterized membrane protein YdbT with pleckstrin-like domain
MFDIKHLPNPIPDEHLVYFLRRHPITLFSLLLSYVVILGIPAFVYWYLRTFQTALLDDPMILTLIVLAGSIVFLFAWLILYQQFLDYYLDLWIVTTKRILSIEQNGLFSRKVSELRLYRIQDVTATVSGVLHTLFDFGDVEIQTAGEKVHFTFEQVPHPNQIAKAILEYSETDRREHIDEAVEEFAMPDKPNSSPGIGKITEP